MNRSAIRDAIVFISLVAIGVVGRWLQPEWGFTPIAAVTIFGGFYFRNWLAAVLLPLSVLSISNTMLPAYDSRGVLLAVYAAMTVPVALGWLLKRPAGPIAAVTRAAACGIIPATIFFLVSNWAVWFFNGVTLGYEPTWVGLAACYTAAIPFFRTMLAGDVVYLAVIFGSYALVHHFAKAPERQVS